jgi:hypothetical protein
VGECPEQEEREGEWEGQEEGEPVGGEVVRKICALTAWWVVDEMGDILETELICLLGWE